MRRCTNGDTVALKPTSIDRESLGAVNDLGLTYRQIRAAELANRVAEGYSQPTDNLYPTMTT